MTRTALLVFSTICLFTSLCAAEESGLRSPDTQKAEGEKLKQIQVLNDRIVNKRPQFSMSGVVKRLADDHYAINGEQFLVNKETQIQGELKTGVSAEVRGFLVPGKPKIANQVQVFGTAPLPQSTDEAPLSSSNRVRLE